MSQMMTNSTFNHIKNLNDTYMKQEEELKNIMNKQSIMFEATIESLFTPLYE